ncbi:MAG: hypothetical protein AB7F89_24750 [Pirellulaceae bacterium]
MKGCLLVIGAIVGSFCLGIIVNVVVLLVTNNGDVSSAAGMAVWFWSLVLLISYGSLWITDPDTITNPPAPTSTIQRWRAEKAESKLQSAELRIGLVFAAIGGMAVHFGKGPRLLMIAVAIGAGVIGGFCGFDLKRRVRRIRERYSQR